MKTKAKLASLMAGIIALGSGCAKDIPYPAEPTIQEPVALERRVEQEIRKHDSWVEKEIEQDYTNEGREGFVSLRRYPKESIEFAKKLGSSGFAAAYGPEEDILMIPEYEDEGLMEQAIDGVDHELWHGLYDDVGEIGIVHREGYSGPDVKEILFHCYDKVTGEEFNELEENLRKREEIEKLNRWGARISDKYKKVAQWTVNTMNSAADHINENLDLNPHIGKEKLKEISDEADAVYRKIEDLKKDYGALVDLASKEIGALKEDESSDEIVRIRERLEKYSKELMKHDTLYYEAHDLRNEIWEIYDSAEDRLIARGKADLENEISRERDPERKKKLQGFLTQLESELEERADEIRTRNKFGELDKAMYKSTTALGSMIRDTVSFDNIYKTFQILHDPNEVMARMVDSLYSLDYGPVTMNKFPLSEDDLAFLERFEYNGHKLFKKGIEKYRLGLEMIEDGKSPEDVKQMLEYATACIYKGKTYRWPESDFKIRGKIRELEATPDEY